MTQILVERVCSGRSAVRGRSLERRVGGDGRGVRSDHTSPPGSAARMHPAAFQEFSSSPGGLCPCGYTQGWGGPTHGGVPPRGGPTQQVHCSLRPRPSPLLSRLPLSRLCPPPLTTPAQRMTPLRPGSWKCGHTERAGWSAMGETDPACVQALGQTARALRWGQGGDSIKGSLGG